MKIVSRPNGGVSIVVDESAIAMGISLDRNELIPLALALLREAGAEAITEIGINDTVIIIKGEK